MVGPAFSVVLFSLLLLLLRGFARFSRTSFELTLIIFSTLFLGLTLGSALTLLYIALLTGSSLAVSLFPNTAARTLVASIPICLYAAFKCNVFDIASTNALGDLAVPAGFSFVMFYLVALGRLRLGPDISAPPLKRALLEGLNFPLTVVGPFVRPNQLETCAKPQEGIPLVSWGFFKFGLSALLNYEFLRGTPLVAETSGLAGWSAPWAASLYLYLNFSGFSDIATGFLRLLGYSAPENFRFPFLAESLADHWRSWHITLISWFRDLVFYPIGLWLQRFPKLERAAMPIAVLMTFLLTGLWHGLSQKFLLWGAGNALIVVLFNRRLGPKLFSIALTFTVVSALNLLFLSRSTSDFLSIATTVIHPEDPVFFARNLVIVGFSGLVLVATWLVETRLFPALASWGSGTHQAISLLISSFVCAVGVLLCLYGADLVYMGF